MSTTTNQLPTLHIPAGSPMLPDTDQWQHRFEVRSASSGNIYIVSQNVEKKFWGCSCPGWISHRKCKHLDALGLPRYEIPYEVNVIE
jgi:hypothetical protein